MTKFLTLFITFIFYAFLGYIYEMIQMSITTKRVVNRGFFNGPIVPIYSVGALLIIFLLDDIKSNVLLTVVLITLICTLVEYLTSYIMEKLFKIRWWDYTDKKYNINGRVCPETMIQFVIMALFVVYFINPLYQNFISNISPIYITTIGITLFILFIVDLSFSLIILKNFLKTDLSNVKDKTPLIREYTKSMIRHR